MSYTEEEQALVTKFTKILNKNKIALMRTPAWAFFTAVCFSLRLRIRFDIPTAATDGLNLYVNPRFMLEFTPAEQLGVLIHEVLHVAYMHIVRFHGLIPGKRGPHNAHLFDLANQAADHVINLQILAKGFKLPDCALKDERFIGMSMEQVYKILLQEYKANPYPIMPGYGGMGQDVMPMPKGETQESIEKKVEQILVQAAIRAKQEKAPPGSIPGDLAIVLEKLLNPKLPWQRLLQRYFKAKAKEDYSWRRPNRRYFPNAVLPSLYSEALVDLAIAVDTSGSVSDHEFSYMVSEIASIFRMMKPQFITLLQFDTRIHTETKIKSLNELMNCKFTGRGGTRVQDVYAWATQNKPQALLVFTDGGFYNPQESELPPKPIQNNTLWLIHDNPQYEAHIGKTVHYDIHTG